MGLFDSIFKKKKPTAKYVIDKEDDQKEFLKSDEEIKKVPAKKGENKGINTKASPSPKKEPAKPAEKEQKKTAPKSAKNSESVRKVKADTVSDVKTQAKKIPAKEPAKADMKKAKKGDDAAIDLERTVAVREGKEIKSGKFDIRRGKDGRFFFCLYASNYAPIAFSQMYSSSAMAMNGISSIIANCSKAPTEDTTLKKTTDLPFPKWEIYIDKAGEYRFRLYATNGLCVCHSYHGYSTKSGCKGGIESIKRFAGEASVDKSYLN